MQVVAVQSLSCVRFFVTPWSAARQASLPLTISQSLPKFMFVESVIPSNRLILMQGCLIPKPVLMITSMIGARGGAM